MQPWNPQPPNAQPPTGRPWPQPPPAGPPPTVFALDLRYTRGRILAITPAVLVLAVLVGGLASIAGPAVGVVVGLAVGGGILGAFVQRANSLRATCSLRMHPWGLELFGTGGVLHQVLWADLERTGAHAHTVMAPLQAYPGVLNPRERTDGVLAWSRVSFGPPRGPKVRLPAFTPDPRTGKTWVLLPLSQYDQQWRQGPIGAWVHAHRPDVL